MDSQRPFLTQNVIFWHTFFVKVHLGVQTVV